jgi:high-affinity Fe2+/Pb2+ permease
MNPVYDLSAYLPDDAGVGLFARAVFGYRAAPELLTLLAQATYLVLGLIFYVRPTRAAAQANSDRVAPAATS